MPSAASRTCHCLLCDGDGKPQLWWKQAEESWDERERRNAQLVRQHGWGVTGVLGGDTPDWAYSIGLWHSYGSPEVCLLGIPQQRAMAIVNLVGRQIRDGNPLIPGSKLTDIIDGYDLTMAPVHSSWYYRLFGAAIDYYQRPPFPVMQLLWPDKSGRYPGDPTLADDWHEAQPSLWLPMDEHPRSAWTEQTQPWTHPDLDPCQIVLTLKRIMEDGQPVIGVIHDHDGSWQFLDGSPVGEPDVATVHLSHIVTHHDIDDLLDLPPGWQAWRQPDGAWLRSTVPAE